MKFFNNLIYGKSLSIKSNPDSRWFILTIATVLLIESGRTIEIDSTPNNALQDANNVA